MRFGGGQGLNGSRSGKKVCMTCGCASALEVPVVASTGGPVDPDFVKRQLALKRDGGEGGQDVDLQPVTDEQARRVALDLEHAVEHNQPHERRDGTGS